MEIKSTTYPDIEVEAEEILLDGEMRFLIKHNTLENLFFKNQSKFTKEEELLFSSNAPLTFVVKATVKDVETGMFAEAIGEANMMNCTTDISKAYPVTMAYKRAFDRAFVRLLQFPGDKTFSSAELDASSYQTSEQIQAQANTVVVNEEPSPYEMPMPAAINNNVTDFPANVQNPLPKFTPETVIMIGETAGYPYGVVRQTQTWQSFVRSSIAQNANMKFPEGSQEELQLQMVRELARNGEY